MPKLSVAEKEALLPRLVRERWLAQTPRRSGRFSIGVRWQRPRMLPMP